MNKNLIITILLVVIVGAGGFFSGRKYQQGKQPTFNRQFGRGTGAQGDVNRPAAFRPVNGDIIASDDKSITVKLQDGSSKIVLFSNSTTINKASEATTADLTVGQKVTVFGMANSDGSVTAQNIQLNPVFRGQN